MFWNFWFYAPLLFFTAFSAIRVIAAVQYFQKDGSLPKDSFDIFTGSIPHMEILGVVASLGGIYIGNRLDDFPVFALAFLGSLAILMLIAAGLGYYLKAMVPRFRLPDESFRFPEPYYLCVKAVAVTANFTVIIFLFVFIVNFLLMLSSDRGQPQVPDPVGSGTEVETPVAVDGSGD